MKIPKLKNINFQFFASLILLSIFFLELFWAYTSLYRNLDPNPSTVVTTNIVRIDRQVFFSTSKFLDDLESFEPKSEAIPTKNPFTYSP